jgi:hypothetical protein
MIGRFRPYWLHVALLTYTPIVLFADSRVSSVWEQACLGALTGLVLWLCTRSLRPHERWQVWLCVVVATGFEVFGSLIWGVYRYRWHNLPLYVPFGHGLVYFFGLTAAGLPVFRRHGRRAAYVVLGACTAWAFAGLTVLPLLAHRLDVQGALCLPVFAWCLLYTPRYAMFAAIFVATTDLELAGTLNHDWAWLARAPWDGVPSGNPPSAIAGGYSIIDGSVALVLALLVRLGVAPMEARRASPSVDRSGPTPSGAFGATSPARGEGIETPTIPGGGGC